jgi:hypothetical protein
MSSTKDGSEPTSSSFEPISATVSEHIAARRLGLSVDTLRRDRRLGQLGIPFVKYGSGKCGAVRYDLADLERFIESKKRRTLPSPVVEVQAPARPVMPALPQIEADELPEEPVDRVVRAPPAAPRRHYRSSWEALAEAAMSEEPEPDPLATGRSPRHRTPGGYFSG